MHAVLHGDDSDGHPSLIVRDQFHALLDGQSCLRLRRIFRDRASRIVPLRTSPPRYAPLGTAHRKSTISAPGACLRIAWEGPRVGVAYGGDGTSSRSTRTQPGSPSRRFRRVAAIRDATHSRHNQRRGGRAPRSADPCIAQRCVGGSVGNDGAGRAHASGRAQPGSPSRRFRHFAVFRTLARYSGKASPMTKASIVGSL